MRDDESSLHNVALLVCAWAYEKNKLYTILGMEQKLGQQCLR